VTRSRQPAVPGTGLAAVRAGECDLGVLSQVIADAFHDLAVSQWLIPDPDARSVIFPGYFQILFQHALDIGLVYTTEQRTAVALWLPAAGPASPPGGYAEQLAEATGPYLNRFLAFDEELARHHPAGLLHHHLAILAVRPDRQGQGIGTRLLDAHHAILDVKGIDAYLEASDELNRGLYQRHGYTDHGQPIQLPGGPVMHPMMREPRPAAWPGQADGT
jgi:GNAT superfamily N-acetyltransferase